MRGKYCLKVKNTDIKLIFDFDKYMYEDSFTINEQSFSKIASLDGEKLQWNIFENQTFKIFREFLILDYKYEKVPDYTNQLIEKHKKLSMEINKLIDDNGDDMFIIERIQ